MRGNPDSAPKSPAESVVGDVSPRASRYDSLSTSKLKQTAIRAPFGQERGVSFFPVRTGATARCNCSSLHFVPGCGGGPGWASAKLAARTAAKEIDRQLMECLPPILTHAGWAIATETAGHGENLAIMNAHASVRLGSSLCARGRPQTRRACKSRCSC